MKFGNWNVPFIILFILQTGKAREELNSGEGSAVCFSDSGQLCYFKMPSVCCVRGAGDGRRVQLTSTATEEVEM